MLLRFENNQLMFRGVHVIFADCTVWDTLCGWVFSNHAFTYIYKVLAFGLEKCRV